MQGIKKRVVILSNEQERAARLAGVLADEGFLPFIQRTSGPLDSLPSIGSDAVLIDLEGSRAFEEDRALIGRIRRDYDLRVIALMGALSPRDEDVALEADDFVLAPFRDEELAARVRRAVRAAEQAGAPGLALGNLLIDTDGCQVLLNGKIVDLTFKEYELLKFLAQNPGKVFTREMLLNQVWGYDYYGGERTVDVHVRRLRGKLEVGGRTFIDTVRGVGYMFKKLPELSVAD